MKELKVYIGSYTEYPIPNFGGIGHGIYSVNLQVETGKLIISQTMMSRNPSYLAIREGSDFLYAVSELDQSNNPKVKGYKINKDSSLTFLNEQLIPGGYPCHIISSHDSVMVACYATGNIFQYPIKANGELQSISNEYHHTGSSINQERQEAPHAHQIVVHPNGKDIYVCDLGIDTIKAYQLKGENLVPNEPRNCKVLKGSGPRHLVFNRKGNLGYLLCELTGTVMVLMHNEDSFRVLNSYKSLPKDYNGLPSSSAIRIHPNGKFLYAANRKSETITILEIDGEELKVLDYQYTLGEELREFNLTPDGNWLIACHQNSHDTVVYEIREDGRLIEKNRTKEILSPVCVIF